MTMHPCEACGLPNATQVVLTKPGIRPEVTISVCACGGRTWRADGETIDYKAAVALALPPRPVRAAA
jgi:hypothetical protein